MLMLEQRSKCLFCHRHAKNWKPERNYRLILVRLRLTKPKYAWVERYIRKVRSRSGLTNEKRKRQRDAYIPLCSSSSTGSCPDGRVPPECGGQILLSTEPRGQEARNPCKKSRGKGLHLQSMYTRQIAWTEWDMIVMIRGVVDRPW